MGHLGYIRYIYCGAHLVLTKEKKTLCSHLKINDTTYEFSYIIA